MSTCITCVFRSNFGHACVYLLKLYAHSCVVGLDTSIFLSVVCNRTFFLSSFCIVHCTLELARNHAP